MNSKSEFKDSNSSDKWSYLNQDLSRSLTQVFPPRPTREPRRPPLTPWAELIQTQVTWMAEYPTTSKPCGMNMTAIEGKTQVHRPIIPNLNGLLLSRFYSHSIPGTLDRGCFDSFYFGSDIEKVFKKKKKLVKLKLELDTSLAFQKHYCKACPYCIEKAILYCF